jgi:D-3-phosphoglycerate dehydrogenase
MTPRILVADPLAEDGIKRLKQVGLVDVKLKLSEDELVQDIGEYDALVVRSETKVTARVIEAAKRLKVIGRAGVGIDNIDVATATKKGIMVVNAPSGNIIAAAEHTIALMLALARRIPQADLSVRRGEWTRSKFQGSEIRDKTLGIIGLGNIGVEVAKRAKGLDMKVIAYDPIIPQDRAEQYGVKLVDLNELLSLSDFVTLHVPLTDSTRNLIGRAELNLMKPSAVLINCARGGVLDEQALYEALKDGKIAGAALDVFASEPPINSPLLELDNVVLTPHIGGSTKEAQISVAYEVADEIAAVLSGGFARHVINAPSIPPEDLPIYGPYIELTKKLAKLFTQLRRQRVKQIQLTYKGAISERDTAPITAAALEEIISSFSEEKVNHINARYVAAKHGITIAERRIPSTGNDTVIIEVKEDGHAMTIEGSVTENGIRLTAIDSFRFDLVPSGRFLISRHLDRPGIIGKVGTLLGANNINIASMQVGRDVPRGRAMMILSVDEEVPPEILNELSQIEGIGNMSFVEL